MRSVICDTNLDTSGHTVGYLTPGTARWILRLDLDNDVVTWTEAPWQAEQFRSPVDVAAALDWLVSQGLSGYEIPVSKLEPPEGVATLPTQ